MAEKKSSKTEEKPSQEAPKKNAPFKTLRKEDVWCNIHRFENPSGVYFSVGFNRSYRTATGEWRSTKYFGLDDLGKLIALAQEAHDFIMSQQQEAA